MYSLQLDWETDVPIEFNTIEHLSSWVDDEQQRWKEFIGSYSGANTLQNSVNAQNKALGRLRSLVNETLALPAEQQAASFAQKKASVEGFFRGQRTFISSSPSGQLILSLSQTITEPAARIALLHLLRGSDAQLASDNGNFAVGALVRELLIRMRGAEAVSTKNPYEAARASELNGLGGRLVEVLEEQRQVAIAREGEVESWRHASQGALADFVAQSRDEIAQGRDQLVALKSYYDEELKLRSVVEYWRATATKSLIWATCAGVAFLAIVGWMFLHWQAPIQQMGAAVATAQKLKLDDINQLVYWVTAGLYSAVPVLAAIWVARLLGRLMMRALVLRDDAIERRTMVLTFLALVKEGATQSDQDRLIVLQALFRPAAIPHLDDAAPSSLTDLLAMLRPSATR